MNLYIGMDIGTSATKACIFNKEGKVISETQQEYDILTPHTGYAEQNPKDWLNAALKCLKTFKNDEYKNVKAIGLSGQMHGLVLLDEFDNVLRPSIIWCDNRTTKEVALIEEKIGSLKMQEITGNIPMPAFTLAKLLWVKNNEPQIYSRINKVLLPKDYIRYMLNGSFMSEYSDMSGTQFIDLKNRRYSTEILNAFDFKEEWFPKIVESYENTGYLKKEIEEETGLYNCYIIGGAGDQAACALGTNITSANDLGIVLGSSGVIFSPLDKYAYDKTGCIQTFCHAIPNTYHQMGVTNGAGTSLKWFKNTLCKEDTKIANLNYWDPYKHILRDVNKVKPGSGGVFFLPYLMGERTPHLDPYASGAFIGITPQTRKRAVARAILEGVSYSMLDCYFILNSKAKKIHISGGGAKNSIWCKIIASMLNLDVMRLDKAESACLGVAILAMVSNKEYPDILTACFEIIKVIEKIEPNDEWHNKYIEGFEIYKELYNCNKDMFYKIHKFRKEE